MRTLQKVVEAFIIILALFELLYLLSLHAGFGRTANGTGAGTGTGIGTGAGAGAGIGLGGLGQNQGARDPNIPVLNHEHHVDYGHHTDKKIPVGHVANPVYPTQV